MRNLFFIAIIALLLVFMGLSIVRKKPQKVSKAALMLILAALIAAALVRWASPLWRYPGTTGPYGVSAIGYTYTDESRVEPYESDGSFRWLNLKFWYPAGYSNGENTCPLVVFSHGSFGAKESNVVLYRELASHGYVVCAIDHTYQCLNTTDPNGSRIKMDSTYMWQILRADDSSEENRSQLYALFSEWMDIRMGDIAFVLDTIIDHAGNGDAVYGLIDPTQIGVMGHSLGGAAALGIGRVRDDVNAVIALEAPFMYDVEGVTAAGFTFNTAPYPVPVLNVYTDSSWNILEDSPQYAQNYTILNDQNETTEDVYFKGAGHMTLTDLAHARPPLCLAFGQDLFFDVDTHTRTANQTYLDFYDRYLKAK